MSSRRVIFDWNDYLRIANELESNPTVWGAVEAAQRCAISRAYYAAFCLARNYALANGLKIWPTDNAHKVVSDYYTSSSDPTKKLIGSSLTRLRRRRNCADYDNIMQRSPAQDASLAVDEAQVLINHLGVSP